MSTCFSDAGLSDRDLARLDALYERLCDANVNALGYPGAKDFSYVDLAPFLTLPLNNIGDPFSKGTYRVDSREIEREVISFFADITRAPKGEWWGYVTNGGTEGNLYGLYLARELLPKGIVYFSEDSHYSVSKNLHVLGMRHIMVRSQSNGEIDYDDLREALSIHRDVPPIIFANIGTTMTEARDDISKISAIMDHLAIRNRYIHADAALCGAYAAFLEPRPHYDFVDGADSISISGHKFIGAPIPCGIALARKGHVSRVARAIDYIGSLDTTISGSRSGFSPLLLWHRIRSLGKRGLRARLTHSLKFAEYTVRSLRAVGVEAWRNPNALTVVLPHPGEAIKTRWQLATHDDIAHIVVMPNVTREQIDALVADIAKEHPIACSA